MPAPRSVQLKLQMFMTVNLQEGISSLLFSYLILTLLNNKRETKQVSTQGMMGPVEY